MTWSSRRSLRRRLRLRRLLRFRIQPQLVHLILQPLDCELGLGALHFELEPLHILLQIPRIL